MRRGVVAGCAFVALLLGCGDAVPPRRVISLSAATTRVAKALELGDRLDSLDPSAPDALERALASGATLAISDTGAESSPIRAAFASRSIPVRVFAPASTDEVTGAYTEIATVLGEPSAASALISTVTRELGLLAKSDSRPARPKVALVVTHQPLRVVAGDAFLSHLLDLAGVENVFAGEHAVTLVVRPEQLQARKPERVLDVSDAVLGGAWLDPVATAGSLRRALEDPAR